MEWLSLLLGLSYVFPSQLRISQLISAISIVYASWKASGDQWNSITDFSQTSWRVKIPAIDASRTATESQRAFIGK